jgi:hypothetical protein
MEIEWADNLADHLRLTDGDKKVAIFHHASFLECQLKKYVSSTTHKSKLKCLAHYSQTAS